MTGTPGLPHNRCAQRRNHGKGQAQTVLTARRTSRSLRHASFGVETAVGKGGLPAYTVLAAVCLLMLSTLVSCGGGSQAPSSPTPAQGITYFPYQQGWLGADGAYSVPLGATQSLWIFGDTFIGAATATSRTQSTGSLHNSIAISTCSQQSCAWQYYWSGMDTASAGPVFSTGTSDWYWPMDGFVYNGTLFLALMQMHATGTGGAFGFAYSGVQLASINNYTSPPNQWSITYQVLNTGAAAVPGVSTVVAEGPNANPDPSNPLGATYAYFFTLIGSSTPATEYMALLRLPLSQLNSSARPGNSNWEYLKSDSTWGNWPGAQTSLPTDLAAVISPGATEMTVRYHPSTNQWIAVYPVGLSNSAYYSLAASMTGPWGQSENLYSYPEMQSSNANYTPNVFCYAAKEHTELETVGQIFFTYACNSLQESDVTNNMSLYHPVVVTQTLPSK